MIAWLVAGQGAEHPGMGVELARSYAPSAELWACASEAAGEDLLRLSETGGRALLRTEYLQPALTAVALGAASFLRDEGLQPDVVLGHSAGEVGAVALAGYTSFEPACALSAMRGRAMASAARNHPGGMAVVRGSEQELSEAVKRGAVAGAIFGAGQTTADTHLITGERAAVHAAAAAKGVSPLPVSGPWHSPLMADAAAELRPHVASAIEPDGARPAWVSNETAERGADDAEAIVELLLAQLTRPMRLHHAIEYLLDAGMTDAVVLGPHHALSHILQRHLDTRHDVRIHGSSSMLELQTLVRELS